MNAQILTLEPANATAADEITLTLDVKLSCPDSALFEADSVMFHGGVTLDGAAWSNVVAFDGMGVNGMSPKFIHNGDSTYSLTFIPNEFFGITAGDVTAIDCVFNAGDWAAGEGKDFSGTDCVDFKIPLTSLSVSENTFESFKLYPNPVESELNIKLGNNVSLVEIYTVTGQKVIEAGNISSDVITINTESLHSGLYFATVHGENGISTVKFVKN